MRPEWFDFENIPYENMWKDDILWYPMLFKDQLFKGFFLFKADQETIVSYDLKRVDIL
jgi:8-oxo-dGTP diphosphatase/2-hydroxy-dATP diphosphatase